MRRKYKDGTPVKYIGERDLSITLTRAGCTEYPLGPWAGYSALIMKKGITGTVISSSHEKFQGWYLVEFPMINCFSIHLDITQENLEKMVIGRKLKC